MSPVNPLLKKLYDQNVGNITIRSWVVKFFILAETLSLILCIDEHIFNISSSNYIVKYFYYLNFFSLYRMAVLSSSTTMGDVTTECTAYTSGQITTNVMIGFIIFILLIILCQALLNFRKNLIYTICINTKNFLLRHFAHFFMYLINTQFLKRDPTPSPPYFFFIIFLNFLFLFYCIGFANYIWSDDADFYYNYKLIKFETFSVILKWIMAVVITIDISKKCNLTYSTNLILFVRTIFIFLLFIQFAFYMIFRKEIYYSNSKINFFRLGITTFLNCFTIFKGLEGFFELDLQVLNLTVFILCFIISVRIVRLLHINITSYYFKNSELNELFYIYLAGQYITLLKYHKKSTSKFYQLLYEKLVEHYLKSDCLYLEEVKCLICKSNPQNYNSSNVENLIFEIFSEAIKSSQFKKNTYYNNLIRLRCLYIICTRNGSENLLFFEIIKIINRQQGTNTKLFFEFLFHKMIKIRDENATFVASQLTFTKAITYIDICKDFNYVCSEIKKTINMVKNKVRFQEIMANAKNIFKIQNIIKVKSEIINEKDSNLLVNFYYHLIFNDVLKDNPTLQKFYENIHIIEENLIKMNILLVECDLREKNLIMRILPFEFIEKLKTKEKNMKNETLTKIFPPDIRNQQMRKIFQFIENENKEVFSLKLILQDDDRNIMYYRVNFKMIVTINEKIHFQLQYKNMPFNQDTSNNYLLVCDEGKIISVSENFKENFYFSDDFDFYKKNLFDIVKINKNEFFELTKTINENYKDFEDSERSTDKQFNLKLEDLFKKEIFRPSTISFSSNLMNEETVKIIVEENIFTERKNVLLLNFMKTKKRDSKMEKDYFNFQDEQKDTVLINNADLFSVASSSINYSVNSSKSSYSRNENIALVITGNTELYEKITNETTTYRTHYFILSFDFLIILGGLVHLVFLYTTLGNFQSTYKGLYYIRTLQSQFSLVTMNSAKEVRLDNSPVSFEEDSLLNDPKMRTLLTDFEYNNIGSKISDLKAFSNNNHAPEDISTLLTGTYIEYVYPSALSQNLEIGTKNFIDLIDLMSVHMNKMKEVTNLALTPEGLWHFEVQDDNVESFIFAFQNFFPVFENYFVKIRETFTFSFNHYVWLLHLISYAYCSFYVTMHFSKFSFFLSYIHQFFFKHKTIINFLSNMDEEHFNFLNYKIDNLRKTVDLVFTPSHLLGKFTKYNKIFHNNKVLTQLSRKNNSSTSLTKLHRTGSINHFHSNRNEKKFSMAPLDKRQLHHIQVHFLEKYVRIISYLLIFLLIFLGLMYSLFNMFIADFTNSTNYTSSVVNIQLNLYSSFVLFQLSLISQLNLTTQLNSGINLNTGEDYFDYYQNISMRIMDSIHEVIKIEPQLSADINENFQQMKGEALCDFSYYKNDTFFKQFSNPQEAYNLFYDNCKRDLKNESHILYQKIPFLMEYLRNSMNSLSRNPSVKKQIISESRFKHETELLLVHVSRFFDRFRVDVTEPLTFEGFNHFFYNLIIILFSSILVEILCFTLIKFCVIEKIKRSNKILLKLLNIFKN
jgi:hypothetical protein